MQHYFWLQRWESRQIGFHNDSVHPLLAAHISAFTLKPNARIFVPLCGKTLDIHWLLGKHYRVVGIDLSGTAVTELFAELGVEPMITQNGALTQFKASGIDVFVGDIMALDKDVLGPADMVYDRAALVALPYDMRVDYANHIQDITARASQLLITFDYDQSVMTGPPFSVSEAELSALYENMHRRLLESQDVKGGLKGQCPATENVWLLSAV